MGWYHFLWPGNIQKQAEWFIRCADPKPGDVLACDWETTSLVHQRRRDDLGQLSQVPGRESRSTGIGVCGQARLNQRGSS